MPQIEPGRSASALSKPILPPSLLENQSTVLLPMNSAHPRGCNERYQGEFIYTFQTSLIKRMPSQFLLGKQAFSDDLTIKRTPIWATTSPGPFWRGACNSLSYANSPIDRDQNDGSHSHGAC
jgi:hypothetical protein